MLPGPVFNVELLTTARRARYFAVRALYGLILLYILWQSYTSYFWWQARTRTEFSIHELSQFASGTFSAIAVAQLVAVLVLTPTMVAGTIADEKQRETLHYLLCSRLSSGEIVLGKLAARLIHVAVFLAIGIPVVSLIGLFGGVDPEWVVSAYGGTFSTAFLLAGLSMWISTVSRRVRDAIIAVYLIEAAGLAIPPLLETLRWNAPLLYGWIRPINEWLLATNPFYTLLIAALGPRGPGARSFFDIFAFMVCLHCAIGLLFIGLAVWRLRPIFRVQGGGETPTGNWIVRARRRWRARRRTDCGDDPMFWKERYFVRSAGLVRWLIRAISLVGGAIMGYWIVYFSWEAIEELGRYGYGYLGPNAARDELNACLRVCTTMLYVLWFLGVAAAASAGITAEKEEDTWVSLVTTPLTGPEIVGAKMLGAVWSMRALGAALVGLWVFGTALGAIHPMGLLAVLLEWMTFTWFVAALGTHVSLRARNTTRATATTVVVIAALNGMYMMCCAPFRPDSPLIMIGCTPGLIAVSQISFGDLWGLLGFEQSRVVHRGGEWVLTCMLGVLGYAILAFVLTLGALKGFDAAVDRPRRLLWGQKYAPEKDIAEL
jgi:ABC-type Na+ efflux pump permease subunit